MPCSMDWSVMGGMSWHEMARHGVASVWGHGLKCGV